MNWKLVILGNAVQSMDMTGVHPTAWSEILTKSAHLPTVLGLDEEGQPVEGFLMFKDLDAKVGAIKPYQDILTKLAGGYRRPFWSTTHIFVDILTISRTTYDPADWGPVEKSGAK